MLSDNIYHHCWKIRMAVWTPVTEAQQEEVDISGETKPSDRSVLERAIRIYTTPFDLIPGMSEENTTALYERFSKKDWWQE